MKSIKFFHKYLTHGTGYSIIITGVSVNNVVPVLQIWLTFVGA
jgi:hypothetical protein